jgi:hypothetical protein
VRRLLVMVALLTLVVPAATAATPTHTVNLANGRFDGHTILGLTPAEVEAVLGKPDSASGSKARYVFDWGRSLNLSFTVIFTKKTTGERARLIGFETGTYRDAKLGDILKLTPAAFLAAMRANYGAMYKLVEPLKRKPGGLYTGLLGQRDGPLYITFGTHAKMGTFVTVWTK